MGTLTDITSKASNKNLRSVDSPVQTIKNAPSQSDNHGKGNFMSPTLASSKKANASTTSTHETRTSTPTFIKLEKASTAKWMTSAARRVGLRRVGGDGNPRSKKEGLKRSGNAVIFPDKLSNSSHLTMPESPRPKPASASSFSDKPLPSPPVAQVMNSNLGEPRSLIDASEKPLQRTSPKSPRKQEEWPVLFPEKPTTPDALREILHQTAPEPACSVSSDQERYPRLSGSQSANSNLGQEPLARLSSSVQIQRKHRDHSAPNSSLDGLEKDTANPTTRTTTKYSDLFLRELKSAHRLSAGAAAVEKSSAEAKLIQEPRQTRTSSLRARISAGQVIKDSPNKVLGFTDFTAEKAPSAKPSKEDLSSATGFRARPSTSFGSKVFTKKPSKEFLGGTRAPAQFVAGSRRPIARRPSSRNSLRSESRASSPTYLEPSRPAPPVPVAKIDGSVRKSSIPVLRNSVSTTVNQAEFQKSTADPSASGQVPEAAINSAHGFELFEDKANSPIREEDSGVIKAMTDTDKAIILEAIEESPRSTFRSKRLSSNSPTFGPMLKISSSADRLIMGTTETNKENRPLVRKRSKDLFRAAVTNEHRNIAKNKTTSNEHKESTSRPLSSQGIVHNRQRNETVVSVPRIEKVKSVDLGSFPAVQESKTEPNTQKLEDSSKSTNSSVADDPFFDAVEQRKSQSDVVEDPKKKASEISHVSELGPTISPVKDTATSLSDAVPVFADTLPETLKQHVHKPGSLSEITRADEVKERRGGHTAILVDTAMERTTNPSEPSTPDQRVGAGGEIPSSTFPPRNSSRMQHPDYTTNDSAKSSPISSLGQAATRLQKEISVTDFANHKALNANSSFHPVHGGAAAHHGLSVKVPDTTHVSGMDTQALQGVDSSQSTLENAKIERNSTTRVSYKSQSSVSKGLMSNFRGLFHKRPSDASEAPNVRSSKKSSKGPTVNSHGSPYPSMSNIHPLHRPTQASINRTIATSQRTSGNSLLSTAPGTPAFNSPLPTEISTTTSLAMQILESARRESSSPKKERLLSLGKIMVDSITQARDAEKAMEEAKQAARKAEVAYALCKKSVGDVANMVKEWRGGFDRF
ncbi:MAG: hypothetical protein Q9172_007626 [Xanthocarpia lactea]